MSTPATTSPLVGGLAVLRERWWLIAVAVGVAVAVSVGLSATATKEYTAQSSLLTRSSQIASLIDPNVSNNTDPERESSTNLLLVQSTAVAERVVRALRAPEAPADMLGKIVANAEPSADIITIDATDPSPQRAARIANEFATQFVEFTGEADRERLEQTATLLRRQIASLAPQSAQRADLAGRLNTIEALGAVTTSNARVVDQATAPGAPSSPKTTRNALLALIVGLVLGVAIAFLIDLFDRRIKTVEDLETLYQMPALTTLPERTRDPRSERDRAVALEPFRILRGSLSFLAADRPIKVVLVTSAIPGEGKSTVAAGLARAAALAGQRVALVETDLRRPTFHHQFDLGEDTRGLSTALVGGGSVLPLLRPVLPALPNLLALPSGPTPPNAGELLRSPTMTQVLGDLGIAVDLVILDAPPLLPVADSRGLLENPAVDAAIIVGRTFHLSRDEAKRTRAIIERFTVPRGLVVNGVRDEEIDYYGTASAEADRPRRTA